DYYCYSTNSNDNYGLF
nr:immunoglobulin light chain junction region [Macaca mulatta]